MPTTAVTVPAARRLGNQRPRRDRLHLAVTKLAGRPTRRSAGGAAHGGGGTVAIVEMAADLMLSLAGAEVPRSHHAPAPAP
jgi:hypothetical protein